MVFLISSPFAFEQSSQSLCPLDISLLCAFGSAREQDDDLGTVLCVIEAPARAEVDAQLNHAVANRLEVAQQAEREALDSFRHRAAYLIVFQSIKPGGELWKRPDGKHGHSVIVRLQNVKQKLDFDKASFCSAERLKAGFGLADSFEANFAAEDGHGFKQRRRVFASADGDADGLKHGAGLQTQMRSGGSQCLVERIMIEGDCGEDFLGVLKNAQGESGIAFLRDQVGWVVGREFFDEEEVGGGDGIAQQLDALANERGDGEKFFRRGFKAGLREKRAEAVG